MRFLVVVEVEVLRKSIFGVIDGLIVVKVDFFILYTSPKSFYEDVVEDSPSTRCTASCASPSFGKFQLAPFSADFTEKG